MVKVIHVVFKWDMLKFLYHPFIWLLISIFVAIIFYVIFPLISSHPMSANNRVIYSALIGTTLLVTKIIRYLRLVTSYKNENKKIDLKALSHQEFIDALTEHRHNKNAK